MRLDEQIKRNRHRATQNENPMLKYRTQRIAQYMTGWSPSTHILSTPQRYKQGDQEGFKEARDLIIDEVFKGSDFIHPRELWATPTRLVFYSGGDGPEYFLHVIPGSISKGISPLILKEPKYKDLHTIDEVSDRGITGDWQWRLPTVDEFNHMYGIEDCLVVPNSTFKDKNWCLDKKDNPGIFIWEEQPIPMRYRKSGDKARVYEVAEIPQHL